MPDPAKDFHYLSSDGCCTDAYLLPRIKQILAEVRWSGDTRRLFDLGCGNGAMAQQLTHLSYHVTGVDPSEEGIRLANQAYPQLQLAVGSGYDDLKSNYGQFPVVLCLEVIEHVYDPRRLVRNLRELLLPNGLAVISTPYHGYWKNLALALSGKLDAHFTALWDHGHIKFWSIRSLTHLLSEAGLHVEKVHRVGRIPALAKSMILCARRASV